MTEPSSFPVQLTLVFEHGQSDGLAPCSSRYLPPSTATRFRDLLLQVAASPTTAIWNSMHEAEAAIDRAKTRWPEQRVRLHFDAWMLLRPPPLLNPFPAFYPAHCDELLERLVSNGDPELPTAAELLAMLEPGFWVGAPLHEDLVVLMLQLADQVLPAHSLRGFMSNGGVPGGSPITLRESFDGAATVFRDQLTQRYLRAMAQAKWRRAVQTHTRPPDPELVARVAAGAL